MIQSRPQNPPRVISRNSSCGYWSGLQSQSAGRTCCVHKTAETFLRMWSDQQWKSRKTKGFRELRYLPRWCTAQPLTLQSCFSAWAGRCRCIQFSILPCERMGDKRPPAGTERALFLVLRSKSSSGSACSETVLKALNCSVAVSFFAWLNIDLSEGKKDNSS